MVCFPMLVQVDHLLGIDHLLLSNIIVCDIGCLFELVSYYIYKFNYSSLAQICRRIPWISCRIPFTDELLINSYSNRLNNRTITD